MRPHLEALRDRGEADARGAQPSEIGKQVERRTSPSIKSLHEHDLDRAALGGGEHARKPGTHAAASGRGLLHIEHYAQATRGRGGTELGARQSRILLTCTDSVVESGSRPMVRNRHDLGSLAR